MDLHLLTMVLTHDNMAASGTDILEAQILVINAYNIEILDKVKDKLIVTKLSGFPRDNFELYCDHQPGLLQRLDDSRFLQPQHLS